VGFPKLYWYGREGDYNLMVIELLGDNLEDLMKNTPGKRFSVLTVLNIADQLVRKNNTLFVMLAAPPHRVPAREGLHS